MANINRSNKLVEEIAEVTQWLSEHPSNLEVIHLSYSASASHGNTTVFEIDSKRGVAKIYSPSALGKEYPSLCNMLRQAGFELSSTQNPNIPLLFYRDSQPTD